MKATPLDATLEAHRATIERLRKGEHGAQLADAPDVSASAAPNVWANVLGPNFGTDNSALLLEGRRRGHEASESTAAATIARRAKEQADAEAALKPRPLTPEQQRVRDEQAVWVRNACNALGYDVNRRPMTEFPPAPPPLDAP
jgi:hypothetical protein